MCKRSVSLFWTCYLLLLSHSRCRKHPIHIWVDFAYTANTGRAKIMHACLHKYYYTNKCFIIWSLALYLHFLSLSSPHCVCVVLCVKPMLLIGIPPSNKCFFDDFASLWHTHTTANSVDFLDLTVAWVLHSATTNYHCCWPLWQSPYAVDWNGLDSHFALIHSFTLIRLAH